MIGPAEMLLVALSPFMGSLIGCIAWRLPRRMNWITGRSACDSCGTVLGAAELVPVLSFLWLGGRCRHCSGRISPAWPAVELAALAVAGVSAWLMPAPAAWAASLAGWIAIAIGTFIWVMHLGQDGDGE